MSFWHKWVIAVCFALTAVVLILPSTVEDRELLHDLIAVAIAALGVGTVLDAGLTIKGGFRSVSQITSGGARVVYYGFLVFELGIRHVVGA